MSVSCINFRSIVTLSTMASPVVMVKEGKLRGAMKNLIDGSKYYSFKGIPYAQPPVGKLRFKAPQPLTPWNGILNAIEHRPVCPQYHFFRNEIIEGSENCLSLNVYTRSLQPDSKIPVLVYIHGGAFTSGSGDADMHGPEFLLQHNVILVTVNYRLEAFGFLCLDIPEVPGNAGLKDQVAALRWVKRNITQFGGDPENVTIFGESAGGAAVTYHMISPNSQGLFHKGISQSGTFLSEWTFRTDGKEKAFKVGKYLGKDTSDPYDLLEFLQSVPSNKLIGISKKIVTPIEKYKSLTVVFTPVVEKEFPRSETFLTEKPIDLLLSGKIQKLPFLTGYNSADGLLFVLPVLKKLEVMNKFLSYFLPQRLVEKISDEKAIDIGNRMKQFYFDNKKLTPDDIERITRLKSDLNIIFHTHRFADFYVEFCESMYMYRFNFNTDLNIIKKMLGFEAQEGACHCDELFYMFKNGMNSDKCEKQQKLKEHVYMMTKLWTDFAKTGNPTPDNRWNIKWMPYTKSNKEYLRIEETLSMGKDDEKDRLDFWNKLYIEAGIPAISKSNL